MLGITFKEDCPDVRNSKVIDLINEIKLKPLESLKVTDYQVSVESNEVEKRIEQISKGQQNFTDKNGYYYVIPSKLNNNVLVDGFFTATLKKNV